jgi:small subunit ribosomal protein S17
MPKRQLKGLVVSDKMQKTVVVSVERIKEHKKYKRRYKINKKYKAHDEKGEYKIGDTVTIEECRPMSKDKRWRVVSLIDKAQEVPEPITKEVVRKQDESKEPKPEAEKNEQSSDITE